MQFNRAMEKIRMHLNKLRDLTSRGKSQPFGSFCLNISVGIIHCKRIHQNGFKIAKRRIRRPKTRQKAEAVPLV